MSKKLNSLQLASLIICPILSASIGIGLYNAIQIAKNDSYISIIIGCIIGLLPIIMLLIIANYQEDKNIIEKINLLFGKTLGTVINYVISILFIIIASTILFGICNFIITQILSNTPVFVIATSFGILSTYSSIKGIETISRTQYLFSFIIIIIFIIFTISLYKEFDISNLKPFLKDGLTNPIKASIFSMLSSIIPTFVILIVPKNNIVDKKNYSKCILIFYGIASLLIIITSLFTIGVLGEHLASFYQYPEYILLKRISIFGFIDRIENLLSISWIFSTFATLSLIIYYISNNLNKKEKKKIPSIIISIIIIVCSLYIFKNNTFFNNYVSNIYPYILSIFFIIFVFITSLILIKRK